MKRLCVYLIAFVFALALITCRGGTGMMSDTGDNLPSPKAESVWAYISKTNPYTEWDHWPGKDGLYPGQSPHGAYLKLYANPVAIEAARAGQTEMPDGAFIVKENYAKDRETLAAVTPMYKVKGYNPSAGDWFWAKYGPDGAVQTAGKVDSCINCHAAVKQNDYIFTEVK